jgi:S-adenosylmethionine decarboxylase
MDGQDFVGQHLILDIWGEIDSLPFWNMDEASEALKQAAVKAGATVLGERWHHFGTGFGYTGVIVLAESHISVHTWSELGLATLDVYMCGNCNPMNTLTSILQFYNSKKYNIQMLERGRVPLQKIS